MLFVPTFSINMCDTEDVCCWERMKMYEKFTLGKDLVDWDQSFTIGMFKAQGNLASMVRKYR